MVTFTKRNIVGLLVLGLLGSAPILACSDDSKDDTKPVTSFEAGAPDTSDNNTNACADAAAPAIGDCSTTKCTATLGEPAVCRNNACVKLKTAECSRTVGPVDDENAVILGVIAPMSGDTANEGTSVINSIDLALRELNQRGVPFADACAKPRKLAAVVCDESADIPTGAEHLAKDLLAPAAIGALYSGDTIKALGKALPNKMLMISPSATAARLTTFEGATVDGVRLFWRTSPSDVIQSAAMAKVLGELETSIKAGNGGKDIKVAFISKSDAYGQGIATALSESVTLNGKPFNDPANAALVVNKCYNSSAFTSPDCMGDLPGAVSATQALDPDVIVLTGTNEAITDFLVPYEALSGVKKPRWIIPDGPRTNDLTKYAKGKPEFRARVRGTVPGVVTPLAQDFFSFRYSTAFPDKPVLIFGMAGAYDATYMLAYAIGAAGNAALTGPVIGTNLAKLIDGATKIDVGPVRINDAFNALTASQKIDINGASGPLFFDKDTGEAPSDIAVWCIVEDPTTQETSYNDSTSQRYDATGKTLTGTFKCE
ncbi:Branched-chain amino acid ABC transporter, amino acid-binding protein [Labilithrix luteola]|uniref:Branched-chain amino acid ABC transporter, amino acid-binding protein n=1 Tax=Labilithrix luteola TaxID=1391654 RepID=A0A0K1PLN4_9BACT|nr:ABC transporter substrate-binding protein [Labilithrix luteola]AKU94024.1 Branched-chain amino acid ABC transporter, amino acid-binding protein [Labilithrix luteola]